VAFVEANPTASISVDGDVGPGFELSADVALAEIPDNPTYRYVYINDRPVLVDANTNTVVWVR
jgi:hypothetical protein